MIAFAEGFAGGLIGAWLLMFGTFVGLILLSRKDQS